MDKATLEQRTKRVALRVVRFASSLPRNQAANVLGHPLLKSGTEGFGLPLLEAIADAMYRQEIPLKPPFSKGEVT